VRVHLYGDPRIHEKVRIRVIGGDYPDATDAVLPYARLIAAGRILDLAPALDGPAWDGTGRWRDTFLPGVLEHWSRDGRVYGLPFAQAVWAIFYNKTMFAEHGWTVPRTWDEFYALCDEIRAAGCAPLTLPGVYMRYGDAFLRAAHYNLVGPGGYRAYNELAPGARRDPRFLRAAGVLQRISTHYLITGWEGMTHTAAEQAFLEGRSAMTISASWLVSEIQGKMPPGFALGAMNFPVFPDGITPAGTLQAQDAYYFVFAKGNPARERATVDFLRFLASPGRARDFARRMDGAAALRGVEPVDYSAAMRDVACLIAGAPGSFDAGPPVSAVPLELVEQAMTDLRQQLMTGRITPEEFGERLEAAAAAQRARLAAPDHVAIRHPLAGGLLLLGFGTLAAGLAWKQIGRRQGGGRIPGVSESENPAAMTEDVLYRQTCFDRLRAPVALGFVGPAFLLYVAFVLAPGLASFAWAFTRWDGLGPRTWVGLFNFKWLLFESDVFWFALRNNLFLMIVPALIVVPLALLFASLIHRGVWGAGVFRAVFLFPNLLGGIAATLLWMSAYEPHGGLVNAGLVALGKAFNLDWLRSFAGYPWLAQDHLYASLIPIYIWMACGFNLILYLAAMEGIDPQLYEAAAIDGAPVWRQFFMITLPLIWEVIVISAVFIVIAGLNAFEMIWLLTSQDPATGTHTLGTLMVSTMFREFQIGRAAALAVVLFGLVAAGSVVLWRGLRREAVES
jgi:raffinose/stachyose/melibiose transport system permease protein